MEKYKELLERYYKGETTLEEERLLKSAARRGELPDEPSLAYQGLTDSMPDSLREKIRQDAAIRKHSANRRLCLQWGSVAAGIVLLACLSLFLPQRKQEPVTLSDNIKRERFENAMRVIDEVLRPQTAPVQRVLYEDNRLIIAIE